MTENETAPSAKGRKIRVAIVGVGNCASSLIQGRYYYENAKPTDSIPGLMHVQLGDYHIGDVEFVAAFDIDREKVGKDLSEAIFSGQNNTIKFMDVPHMGVTVRPRDDPRRPGQVPVPGHREGPRPHGRRRRDPQGAPGRPRRVLPARGQRGGHEVVRGAGAPGRRGLRQRHPGVHRP